MLVALGSHRRSPQTSKTPLTSFERRLPRSLAWRFDSRGCHCCTFLAQLFLCWRLSCRRRQRRSGCGRPFSLYCGSRVQTVRQWESGVSRSSRGAIQFHGVLFATDAVRLPGERSAGPRPRRALLTPRKRHWESRRRSARNTRHEGLGERRQLETRTNCPLKQRVR